ncbi:MAG: hypothetical protein ACYTEQ_26760 [Planctomycetota bacterium]|jgi:hypothetical protein
MRTSFLVIVVLFSLASSFFLWLEWLEESFLRILFVSGLACSILGFLVSIYTLVRSVLAFKATRVLILLILLVIAFANYFFLLFTTGLEKGKKKIYSAVHRVRKIELLGDTLVELAKGPNHGRLPSHDSWADDFLAHQGRDASMDFVFSRHAGYYCKYAYNRNIADSNLLQLPPKTVLVFESDGPWNLSGGEDLLKARIIGKYALAYTADSKLVKYYYQKDAYVDSETSQRIHVSWKPEEIRAPE